MALYVLEQGNGTSTGGPMMDEVVQEFMEAMNDDLNSEKALAVVFSLRNKMVDWINQRDIEKLKKAAHTLEYCCTTLLGMPLNAAISSDVINTLKEKLAGRDASRKAKDWKLADSIRKEIHTGPQ